jgi:hypothetical protein
LKNASPPPSEARHLLLAHRRITNTCRWPSADSRALGPGSHCSPGPASERSSVATSSVVGLRRARGRSTPAHTPRRGPHSLLACSPLAVGLLHDCVNRCASRRPQASASSAYDMNRTSWCRPQATRPPQRSTKFEPPSCRPQASTRLARSPRYAWGPSLRARAATRNSRPIPLRGWLATAGGSRLGLLRRYRCFATELSASSVDSQFPADPASRVPRPVARAAASFMVTAILSVECRPQASTRNSRPIPLRGSLVRWLTPCVL